MSTDKDRLRQKVYIRNKRQLEEAFERIVRNVGAEMAEAIKTSAYDVRGNAIRGMQRHQSQGVTYEKTDPKRTHTASLPGFSPNTDTGTLVTSIAVEPNEKGDGMLIGTSIMYGKHLEFGTTNIKARPWLHPALQASARTILYRIRKAIRDGIKNA